MGVCVCVRACAGDGVFVVASAAVRIYIYGLCTRPQREERVPALMRCGLYRRAHLFHWIWVRSIYVEHRKTSVETSVIEELYSRKFRMYFTDTVH